MAGIEQEQDPDYVAPLVPITVTCDEGGCVNYGVAITLLIPEGSLDVVCGPCAERILAVNKELEPIEDSE